jgi:hypothetical protein
MGGEQIGGPEDHRMTAASRQAPYGSCCTGVAKRRPGPNVGKAVVLWEETGKCTMGAAGVGVPARRERFAEITPGRSSSQPGLTATGKDSRHKAYKLRSGEGGGLAHESVVAMKVG